MAYFPKDLSDFKPEEINELAYGEGKKYVQGEIKTNQIRNIFSTVEKMRSDFKRNNFQMNEEIRRELVMLRPKLAYAAGRHKVVRPFQELFDEAIKNVLSSKKPSEALKNFFFLAEAIVAYHKYFGGKDN